MWQNFFDAVLAFVLVLFGLSSVGELEQAAEVPAAQATSSWHVVERVIDGDTIDIDTGERVRFLGVDTPERDECYFAESTDFVRSWLEGKEVRLEQDVRDRDVHGRLLRYIFIAELPGGGATSSEQLVNQVLLERGYARSLPIGPDDRYRTNFYSAQQTAQAAAEGKWGVCQ